MNSVLHNAEQVTPQWLTSILQKREVLARGRVIQVIPDQVQTTFASSVCRLGVSYSWDATPGVPRKLFLKLSHPDLVPGEFDPEHLRQEIVFYTEVAPFMGANFAIPCYDAVFDPSTGASHLLLKDVSETHTTCNSPLSQPNCEQAIDCLAHLHAFWWDHPRLGKDIGRFTTEDEREADCLDTVKSTNAFMTTLGDQIRPAWRSVYERVLPALPRLFKRHALGRNLTLVHGDAHLGNFLFPGESLLEITYLIDWQFWHVTIGGTDLAFMIATEWDPEVRQRLEIPLLRRYYQGLLEHGVRDYSWEECWNDYRLSVILVSIFIPVWRWAVFKWSPDLSTLATSMTAFEDLQCSELL